MTTQALAYVADLMLSYPNVKLTFTQERMIENHQEQVWYPLDWPHSHPIPEDAVPDANMNGYLTKTFNLGVAIPLCWHACPTQTDFGHAAIVWENPAGGYGGASSENIEDLYSILNCAMSEVESRVLEAEGAVRDGGSARYDDAACDIAVPDWERRTFLHISLRAAREGEAK